MLDLVLASTSAASSAERVDVMLNFLLHISLGSLRQSDPFLRNLMDTSSATLHAPLVGIELGAESGDL